MYYLSQELLTRSKLFDSLRSTQKQYTILLLSAIPALLTMVSPWHLHFTRTGFESGMSLTLLVWGLWAFSKLLTVINRVTTSTPQTAKFRIWNILSAGFLASSMYTYHSAKVAVPLLAAIATFAWWRSSNPSKLRLKHIGLWVATVAVLLIPMGLDSFRGEGLERAGTTVLFQTDLSVSEKATTILTNTVAHFTPGYLIQGETATLRHGSGAWGILLPTTAFFVLVSLLSLFLHKQRGFEKKNWFLFQVGLIWLLVGTLPAAIGMDVPHSNRALLALPGFMMLAFDGVLYLYSVIEKSTLNYSLRGSHGELNMVPKIVFGMTILIHVFFVVLHQHHYYTVFAAESSADFQDGYLEAFEYVVPLEQGIGTDVNYQTVLFTSDYGQPYIYVLFVRETNPIRYRQGALVKYIPDDQIGFGDLNREKTIIVASESDDIPVDQADKVVYGSDGEVRFKIYLTE